MTSCQFPVRLQPSLGGTVSAEARRVMGDLQHFCLRWNNYQNSITTAFENLRDDEDFIDVTLACDGKSLKAHRVVLSACSPYFRELLKSTPCKHPVIVLQDVVFDDLQALVEFIYHGEVNVHQRNLSSFLKTAEVLRVSGLTQPSDSASNDHSARQSSETPPAENSFLSLAAQAVEGRVSPQVRQRKGFPQQSPSSIPSPRSKENSPIPLNKRNNKTLSGGSNGGGGGGNGGGGGGGGGGMDLSERTSQHSPGSAGSRPNCMDDEDSGERSDGGSGGGGGGGGGGGNGNGLNMMHDEPPMDYSRTHQLHAVAAVLHQQQQQQQQQDTAQNLMVPRRSSPAEVKSEPMDTASSAAPLNNSGGGGAYGADDCSNDSAADFTGVHPAVGMSEPDDTSYQSHHSYLDSKFFAAAGAATFNFSMAAAMAADSLAGLNNHNHTNVMEALGGSSSQDWSEAGGGVGVGGAETLSCFVCGKRLSTRLTLKRHIEQQHNQPLHSAVCNVCNKVFRTLNSLNNHKSIYHRKPKAYKSTAGGGTVVASAAAAAVAAAGLVPPASSPDGTGDGSAAATAPKNLPPLTVWYKNNNNNHNNNNNGNGN